MSSGPRVNDGGWIFCKTSVQWRRPHPLPGAPCPHLATLCSPVGGNPSHLATDMMGFFSSNGKTKGKAPTNPLPCPLPPLMYHVHMAEAMALSAAGNCIMPPLAPLAPVKDEPEPTPVAHYLWI